VNTEKEYDVIVVGSGAGGSTVAREMTKKGKKVLLLERGGNFKWMGNTFTLTQIYKRMGLTRSTEGYNVVFPDNLGGASNITAGCALPPQKSVWDPVGINLEAEAEEARGDLGIQVLPDELIGKTNIRIMEAANEAGYNWHRLENFIDPAQCTGSGDCMLGCKNGAKWTAREYIDEALTEGMDLKLHTRAKEIIVENGKAIGVKAGCMGKTKNFYGKKIVLSAGLDNVHLLRKAGIDEAGRGFCCDWLQFVGGIIPGLNTASGNSPMTVGTNEHYETDGLVLTPVFPNWTMFAAVLFFMGMGHMAKFPNYWKYSGVMVKVRDETRGEIFKGLKFSKPVTDADQKKLDKGVDIITKILKQAGAPESSILPLKPMGAHPSATCRIGEVVDTNLKTEIDNLYCCDASVMPASLGTPVIWTVVSLGKRLAKHLG